jgi:hypothetical protein
MVVNQILFTLTMFWKASLLPNSHNQAFVAFSMLHKLNKEGRILHGFG